MAEFNKCSNLLTDEKFTDALEKYNRILDGNEDPFTFMYKMQVALQRSLREKNNAIINVDTLVTDGEATLGERYDWLRDNKIALDDEFRETIDALPGMSLPEKDRSAIWKKWKAKYNELRAKKLSDLSKDDLKELKFEVCDMFHFFMNLMIGIGLTPDEMFVFYYYKNAENFDRIKRKY